VRVRKLFGGSGGGGEAAEVRPFGLGERQISNIQHPTPNQWVAGDDLVLFRVSGLVYIPFPLIPAFSLGRRGNCVEFFGESDVLRLYPARFRPATPSRVGFGVT